MNGQIQYGSAKVVTSGTTHTRRRRPRFADPARFRVPHQAASRSVMLLFGGSLLLGGVLSAVPRGFPDVTVVAVVGGIWVSVVLALMLPSSSERAGAELTRRLGQFRHELNALGDRPSRPALEALLARARHLELRDDEIETELAQIRASIEALDLARQIGGADLPIVTTQEQLAPGDRCHFAAPVRFGRRRTDHFGHLMLTSGWLKFRGGFDVSVTWSEVSGVSRAGREVIVQLHDSKRMLRFGCHSASEAAQAGVLAMHLARSS